MKQGDAYLFTLRIWRETLDDGRVEWRGRVQRVPQGQVRYFRSWQMLVDHLLRVLTNSDREDELPAISEDLQSGTRLPS